MSPAFQWQNQRLFEIACGITDTNGGDTPFTGLPLRELKSIHTSITIENRADGGRNFFDHKYLGNTLLQ
jgi:hypothetical protein